MRTRLVLCAILLLQLLPPVYFLAQDIPPGTPDDVRKILEKAKHGQIPTPAEMERIQEWSRGVAEKATAAAATGNTQYAHGKTNEGIPCRISTKYHAKANYGENSQETTLDVTADAMLFASVNGNGDYYASIADPSVGVSVFRFEPVKINGEASTAGKGHYRFVSQDPGHPDYIIDADVTRAAFFTQFFTNGQPDELYPMTGKDNDPSGPWALDAEGTESLDPPKPWKSPSGYHFTPTANPFAMETHLHPQQFKPGEATPQPVLKIPFGELTQAIKDGTTKEVKGQEEFSWQDGEGTITGTASLSITLRPPQLKFLVEPADQAEYEKWLPRPIPEDMDDPRIEALFGQGSRITFHFKLVNQDGSPAALSEKMDFNLKAVSSHKGITSNYPKDNANSDPDLLFSPPSDSVNQAIDIDPDDPTHATLKDEATEADITVEARDTGAYGKLTGEIKGLGLTAQCDKCKVPGLPFVRVPKDDNDNHIGDQWEDDHPDIKNHPATWDEEDRPELSRHGDSLSLYEEYRGFVVADDNWTPKWQRLEPGEEKVFVFPYSSDRYPNFRQFVRHGAEKYQVASGGIHVYFISDLNFLKQDPQVDNWPNWANFNSETDDRIDFGPKAFVIPVKAVSGIRVEGLEETKFDISSAPTDRKFVYASTLPVAARTGNVPRGPYELTRIELYPDAAEKTSAVRLETAARLRQDPTVAPDTFKILTAYGLTAAEYYDRFTNIAPNMVAEYEIWTVMHEMGHATGAHHHVGDPEKDPPLPEVPSCPMTYWDELGPSKNMYLVPAYMGIFHPASTAWIGDPIPGHSLPWAFCPPSLKQMSLKPSP